MHGSANFSVQGGLTNVVFDDGPQNVILAVDGSFVITTPGAELRAFYEEGAQHPLICYYAPDKPPHLHRQLKHLPLVWEHWVKDAAAVIVIGANTDSGDRHVWLPLIRDSKAQIYYAGSDGRGIERNVPDRYHYIGRTFEEAAEVLPDIL
jgi:hypothetical protein